MPQRRSCSSSEPPLRSAPCATWSPAPAKSQIAFGSFRNGQFDAYVMNTDGSGQRRLTARRNQGFPVWSPDGRKIVYVRGWPGNPDLYVMNADGRASRLTRPGVTRALSSRLGPDDRLHEKQSADGSQLEFGRVPVAVRRQRHQRRRQWRAELDGRRHERRTRVVARRADDRLYESARRLRPVGRLHLRHERGRERAAGLTRDAGFVLGLVTRRAEDRLRARGRPG